MAFLRTVTVILVCDVGDHVCCDSLQIVAERCLCSTTEQRMEKKPLVVWTDLSAGTVVLLNRVG